MTKLFQITLIASLLNGTQSCEQKTKATQMQDISSDQGEISFSSDSERKMNEFDALDKSKFMLVKSLRWEEIGPNNTRFIEVEALLNEDGLPVQITEYFTLGNFQEEGERVYYLDQNEIYALVQRYDSWVDSNYAIYNEKQLFYEKGAATSARHRSAGVVEEIDQEPWNIIRADDFSNIAEVRDVLNGEGRFTTHYLSYIPLNEELFLLVGEPTDEIRMQSALKVPQMTPFLEQLLKHSKQHKFKPLAITFEVVGGNGMPEYRVLSTIDWGKTKQS